MNIYNLAYIILHFGTAIVCYYNTNRVLTCIHYNNTHRVFTYIYTSLPCFQNWRCFHNTYCRRCSSSESGRPLHCISLIYSTPCIYITYRSSHHSWLIFIPLSQFGILHTHVKFYLIMSSSFCFLLFWPSCIYYIYSVFLLFCKTLSAYYAHLQDEFKGNKDILLKHKFYHTISVQRLQETHKKQRRQFCQWLLD